jgi:hypothetical protein
MAEVFVWREASAYWWTGTATASAQLAYAENVRVALTRGWDNFQRLAGTWGNNQTGTRADVQIGTLYHVSNLQALFDSATAVHWHFMHLHALGSAGIYLYSGRIDTLELVGDQAQPFRHNLTYHANNWSGY